MAKFYGKIGYSISVEDPPGVWTPTVITRYYRGDIIKNNQRWQNGGSDKVNDDFNISNRISVLADPFAFANFASMKYVEFMGTPWKITDAEIEYPRIILTIGGVYNGETA